MQYNKIYNVDLAPCEAQAALRQMQREAQMDAFIEDHDRELRAELAGAGRRETEEG